MSGHEEFFKRLVPKLFWKAHLTDFNGSVPAELPVRVLECDGALVYGMPGTGKTYLAAALVRELMEPCRIVCTDSFYWGTSVSVLRGIIGGFRAKDRPELDVEEVIRTGNLVVLDDLGSENPTEWARAILLDLVNSRIEAQLPTIITTNMGFQEFKDLNPRLCDRLRDFEPVKLDGDSRRGRRKRDQ